MVLNKYFLLHAAAVLTLRVRSLHVPCRVRLNASLLQLIEKKT